MPIVPAPVMRDDIDRIQAFAAEHSLDVRPHVKTHKCVEIGRRQVKAETDVITAGNVGEAEVFAEAGFDGIFLACPIRPAGTKGPRIRWRAETTRLRVGVDNVAAISALADAMGDDAGRLEVLIEIAEPVVPVLPVGGGHTAFQHRPTRFPDTESKDSS